jgi:hypothetical protein
LKRLSNKSSQYLYFITSVINAAGKAHLIIINWRDRDKKLVKRANKWELLKINPSAPRPLLSPLENMCSQVVIADKH